MRAMTPWTGMSLLRGEMDRLFDRFFEPKWTGVDAMAEWPRLDVSETDVAVVVKAEVPGVEAKEIQVTLQDQVLTIKGEKRQEKEHKDEQFHRVERSYGSFARVLGLPAAVDGEKVTAEFKDGLLTITLPKTPAAKGTLIPVKAG